MKKITPFICFLFIAPLVYGQTSTELEPLLQNVYGRNVQRLNGYWNYIIDPLESGYYDYRHQPAADGFFKDVKKDSLDNNLREYDFDASPVMAIPGDWNTQNRDLFYYEGTVWFRQKFQYQPSDKRTFLYFGAVNYDAKVYVNGKKVGEHYGGFTPFNFDVTDKLMAGENVVIVKVDNKRSTTAVPTDNFDWFNYGGITRDVLLVEVPKTYIQTYKVQLKKGSEKIIKVSVKLNVSTAGIPVTIAIPELKLSKIISTNIEGVATWEGKESPKLWSPKNPKLYKVIVSTYSDKVTDEIGFRQISARGNKVLLNGKSIFLKGVSIHEEAAFRSGRIFSADEARILLAWAKDLGCNYVRLAHYPHNEQMVREAEKMGLMVWDEIPLYWTIHWDKLETYTNAMNQLDEMMERDQNRAGVIIWSLANETPVSEARNLFLGALARMVREKDDTRLISMAMERKDKSKEVLSVNDDMSKHVDIISFNQYVGWYDGPKDKLDQVKWEIDYDKPIIISEFGGGALAGRHGGDNDLWSEEYQADLYRKTLKMIDERTPTLVGISPWVLKDFRSPRRLLPQIQDGFNRKGLISDRGERKQAFFILQEWYKKK
ncbi:beta-glucuronidase [Bacteroidia bacterium]|nr:beta-glucuronidase [Bacteroidia bacterium]